MRPVNEVYCPNRTSFEFYSRDAEYLESQMRIIKHSWVPDKIPIPLMKKPWPTLTAASIVGVQPLLGTNHLHTYMRHLFGKEQ